MKLSPSQASDSYPTLIALLRSECQTFDDFLQTDEGTNLMYRLNQQFQHETTAQNPHTEMNASVVGHCGKASDDLNPLHGGAHVKEKVGRIGSKRSDYRAHTDVISRLRNQFGVGGRNLVSLNKQDDFSINAISSGGDKNQKR
ncbi:unnamed protein product [Mesocestoides corti]|nr:unnamed protein product [Mesocestoides corti]